MLDQWRDFLLTHKLYNMDYSQRDGGSQNYVLTPIDRAMKERRTNTETLITQCEVRLTIIKKRMLELSNEEDRVRNNLQKLQNNEA